jgi:hypothetical protein
MEREYSRGLEAEDAPSGVAVPSRGVEGLEIELRDDSRLVADGDDILDGTAGKDPRPGAALEVEVFLDDRSEACPLCGRVAPLVRSHILPRFTVQWLKDHIGSGYFRSGATPNKRSQDYLAGRLLCLECEQLFSRWEKNFAEEFFIPYQEDSRRPFRYGPWFSRFAVSISWRVLAWSQAQHGLEHLTPALRSRADEVLKVWGEFLLGERPNPGAFEQHFFPMDVVESYAGVPPPPTLNRYILTALDCDVAASQKSAMTYAKMGRFVLLGFIEMRNAHQWKGSKLKIESGEIWPRAYKTPPGFGNFFLDRVKGHQKALMEISERQGEVIQAARMKEPDRVLASESVRAMKQDILLSGLRAFSDAWGDEEE